MPCRSATTTFHGPTRRLAKCRRPDRFIRQRKRVDFGRTPERADMSQNRITGQPEQFHDAGIKQVRWHGDVPSRRRKGSNCAGELIGAELPSQHDRKQSWGVRPRQRPVATPHAVHQDSGRCMGLVRHGRLVDPRSSLR